MLSSVILNHVVFVSSLTVDSLSRKLYWIDSAKVIRVYFANLPYIAEQELSQIFDGNSRIISNCVSAPVSS